MFLGGSAQIITVLHRGGYRNLLQYYMRGGSSRFITILQWGGSLRTPNLYYVIYGRPLNGLVSKMYEWMGEWSGEEWMGDTPYTVMTTLAPTVPKILKDLILSKSSKTPC